MSEEKVKYIGDFQPNLPGETDYIDEGDNHIRNLKIGYTNSFPFFNSELSYSNTELNTIREYLNGNANDFLWNRPFPLVGGQVTPSDYILGYEPNGELSLTNDMLPIGSIVPSWLTLATFTQLYKYGTTENDFHFDICAGASITGTALNRLLGVDPYILPDLRNRYLRQAIDEGQVSKPQDEQVKVSSWTFPLVTLPIITTAVATSTNHGHSPGTGSWTITFPPWTCKNQAQNATNVTPNTGFTGTRATWYTNKICTDSRMRANDSYSIINNASHTHIITSKLIGLTTNVGTTGTETMPSSVCMNYYIRVD